MSFCWLTAIHPKTFCGTRQDAGCSPSRLQVYRSSILGVCLASGLPLLRVLSDCLKVVEAAHSNQNSRSPPLQRLSTGMFSNPEVFRALATNFDSLAPSVALLFQEGDYWPRSLARRAFQYYLGGTEISASSHADEVALTQVCTLLT